MPEQIPNSAALNQDVKSWAQETSGDLLDKISELNIVDTGNLFRRLRHRLGHSFGEVEKISYGFPRYGVFVEKGVGRGRPVGSPKAKQYARPWFNPTLDNRLPDLANRVARHSANLAVKSIKIQ